MALPTAKNSRHVTALSVGLLAQEAQVSRSKGPCDYRLQGGAAYVVAGGQLENLSTCLQGFLTYKKTPPPRTLPKAYA